MASHSDQSWIYFSCVLVHQKSLMHPQLSVSLLSWVWLKPMLDPNICSQAAGCKITLDLSWLLGPQSEILETTQNHLKLGRSCYLLPLVMGIDLSWSVANTASQELICGPLVQTFYKHVSYCIFVEKVNVCHTELVWCSGKDLSPVWNPGRYLWWTFPGIQSWNTDHQAPYKCYLQASSLPAAGMGFRAQDLGWCFGVHSPGPVWVLEMPYSHMSWELPQVHGDSVLKKTHEKTAVTSSSVRCEIQILFGNTTFLCSKRNL